MSGNLEILAIVLGSEDWRKERQLGRRKGKACGKEQPWTELDMTHWIAAVTYCNWRPNKVKHNGFFIAFKYDLR